MNIDFSNIRTHDGSQNSGFEELVCQLARLQKPENALRFVRKEGAGGDAGVECYWILGDGSEICWQAKYFLDGMNPSRWKQIDKSFEAALERHPNLAKYVVCLPLDKSDSRKKGKSGKQVMSVEDKWRHHVSGWKEAAREQGRDIEFEYWGKHELTLFLMADNPLYSGLLLYWFKEPLSLGLEMFKRTVYKARESLGDRYTPDLHVDLPVAGSFDGLCLNDRWRENLAERVQKLNYEKNLFFTKHARNGPDTEEIEKLRKMCSRMFGILADGLNQGSSPSELRDARSLLREISGYFVERIRRGEDFGAERESFHSFFDELRNFSGFLQTGEVKAAEIKAVLLYGDAGIGKSHLLCDISFGRIEENLPTILLLGSQYGGGNPIELLKDAVDLKQYGDRQVLGAIDAAAAAHGSRALIAVDAINEGPNRDNWRNHLAGFLSELSGFDNIAVLLSCRSTYLRYILPESIDEERLVRIEHPGFRGYEHRATEIYLSQQGISKPSAPMLAPEFTNPLFLKTCCQTLKARGESSFPKGLKGINDLFSFYVESLEETVARKKRYTPGEKIVENALKEFALKLFPDHLAGIPKGEARSSFNARDPNPNTGSPLFEELLDEGILSEDVLYEPGDRGKPVIRFTYERFSDYFVALKIVERNGSRNIADIFSADGPLGKIISAGRFQGNAGIFEALAIIIAEKHEKELADVLPDDTDIDEWQLAEMFSNTVIWRPPDSFSEKTLELLNRQIEVLGDMRPATEILLKLATEPGHPWNAEFLNRNLLNQEVAERDSFWSVSVALSGDSSKTSEKESAVTTLIEWSCFGDIEEVEEERIKFCAVALLWLLTTPNREVRDRSTKSLVRIFSRRPSLLPELLREFHQVNDLYLTERLYAAAYGAVCNASDQKIISRVADTVFELVFKDRKPPPHMLLRDYARGILELALHRKLLPDHVDAGLFRPPYESEWPLENPSEEEIDALVGDEERDHYGIKKSLTWGDFGKYTMSCVHDWSPTALTEPAPETGYEVKKKFAEKHLRGKIKEEYLEKNKPLPSGGTLFVPPFPYDPEGEVRVIGNFEGPVPSAAELFEYDDEDAKESKRRQEAAAKFEENLREQVGDRNREYYRWLSGLHNDSPASFSRKWAQRWTCKRAYELGWSRELFFDFEKMHCSLGRGMGSSNETMERVGEKYQWIAFHEFLAHLSDNMHWIDRDHDHDDARSVCQGPWQIYKREIDPTIWIKIPGEHRSYPKQVNPWWQPYSFSFSSIRNLVDQKKYLWDEEQVPEFFKLLRIKEPGTRNQWTVLQGFWWEKERENYTGKDNFMLKANFSISAIFVRKEHLSSVEKKLRNEIGEYSFNVQVPPTPHQCYLGEYPWHPVCESVSGWNGPEDGLGKLIQTEYFIPVSRYEWESGDNDYSIDRSLSFYLPAKELVESLELRRTYEDFGSWGNEDGVVFRDPSVKQDGPSYALIDSRKLNEWLDENGLDILWLIDGEKELLPSNTQRAYGSQLYRGLFKLVGDTPTGSLQFENHDARQS